MDLRMRRLLAGLILLGATAGCSQTPESVCGETNVGIPLKGRTLPVKPRNSDDVIRTLGAPFFAQRMWDSAAGTDVDVIVYVDGSFKGSKIRNASDSAIQSLSIQGCGMQLIYRFWPDGRSQTVHQALLIEDLMRLYATQAADSSWAEALPFARSVSGDKPL